MKYIYLITFTGFSFYTFSQNSLEGVVMEQGSSVLVENAKITIETTSYSANSDANGRFLVDFDLPEGAHVATVTKKGYDTKMFLFELIDQKTIGADTIKIQVDKSERKRRNKVAKQLEKFKKNKENERQKKIKELLKSKNKNKRLAQSEKRKSNAVFGLFKRKNSSDEALEFVSSSESAGLMSKFSMILEVSPDLISNLKLYEFIDQWIETPYLLGGETREGIDCSSFTQRLYTSVFDMYIERTAQKQFDSKLTDKFLDLEFLHEGDLIFFSGSGRTNNAIAHVGVYLQNGKFVHSTSHVRDTGKNGVKISNLNHNYWKKRIVAAGRRVNN